MPLNKPCLTMITSHFPCAHSGDFFEDALPYLQNEFSIRVVSLDTQNDQTRSLPEGAVFTRMPTPAPIALQLRKIPFLFSRFFWKQIMRLKELDCLSFHTFMRTLTVMSKSRHLANYLTSLPEYKSKLPLIYYSFISNEYLLAPILAKKTAKKNVKSIIRCRGIDIERFEHDRCLEALTLQVDRMTDSMYFDCEDRMRYFMKRYANKPTDPYKYMVSKFGVNDHGIVASPEDADTQILHLLTRTPQDSDESVRRMLNALSAVSEGKIQWTHIGADDTLKEQAMTAFAGNEHVTYRFVGEMGYADRIKLYAENRVHCMVYLSKMPCLPFEVIECMSCGIFPIVLNIGGIDELVDKNNGLLLPADVTDAELTRFFEMMTTISNETLAGKGENARKTFLESYTAEQNCKTLSTQILGVLAE